MKLNKPARAAAALLLAAAVAASAACSAVPGSAADSGEDAATAPVAAYTERETSAAAQTKPETEPDTSAEPAAGKVYENITYKTVGDKELQLDIYGPTAEAEGKTPVLLYIHGGSWISGDRSLGGSGLTAIFDKIRALGVAVVPVTYRLTTAEVTFPAHINDVCDAVRFIVKHADEYNFDIKRIGLIGFSAGGQLSLLAGFRNTAYGDDPELAGTDFDIKCVIDFCGPTDFTQPDDYTDDAQRIYALALLDGFLGAPLAGNERLYASASPITYAGDNPDLALIIFQGRSDELVPYVQVDRLYEKCVKAGMDVKYVPVDNATHGFSPADKTKPISPSMTDIINDCITFVEDKLL